MLMNLYQTAALLALLVTAGCGLSSCSGATDDSETALAVELAYDKASIDADGESAVTFTVKQGGVDITAKATISYTYGEETKELAQATFSTNVAGTYTFTATYDGVTSEKTSKYRLAVYVLEDGIVYPQADGSITRDDYVHNHVVRKLIAASGLVEGDDLGEIASGKEATKTYQVNIDKAWNIENLSFYALALDAENRVNNLSVCAAKNGKTDYEYNKNN